MDKLMSVLEKSIRQPIKICECGCGKKFRVNKRWIYRKNKQRFISGHNLNILNRSNFNKEHFNNDEYKKKKSIDSKRLFKEGKIKFYWQLGIPNPNKGKHISKKTKEKLRIANLGKHHTPETKEKCRKIAFEKGYGLWMNGKKATKESRIKMSNALKGKMPKNLNYEKRLNKF
jgi:hypothetical protein